MVLLGVKSFKWDLSRKGSQIQLFNNHMTANRGRGSATYETVLGTLGFSSGRHYWEIKLDAYGHEDDIFIGVCKQEVKVN